MDYWLYGTNYLRGGFTDDEISAGIPFLLENEENEHRIDKKEVDRVKTMLKKKLVKRIAGINNGHQIKAIVIKTIFEDHVDYMIKSYALEESLPFEFLEIARQDNCLQILIKGFLKKYGGVNINDSLKKEIDILIEKIYLEKNNEIVYERVGYIQNFIHYQVDAKHGRYTNQRLSTRIMKNLLSTCRLHLNLYDIKCKDIQSLLQLRDVTYGAIRREYEKPSQITLLPGKKFIPIWKAIKMKPFPEFLDSNVKSKITNIKNSECDPSDLDGFRDLMIRKYFSRAG